MPKALSSKKGYTEIRQCAVEITQKRISNEHLIAENTACPPIHRLSVAIGLNDFGCEVLGCPAQRPYTVVDDLGEPKVGNFEVAAGIKQEILRFEITIDNVERAKVAECEDDDGQVEPGYSRDLIRAFLHPTVPRGWEI